MVERAALSAGGGFSDAGWRAHCRHRRFHSLVSCRTCRIFVHVVVVGVIFIFPHFCTHLIARSHAAAPLKAVCHRLMNPLCVCVCAFHYLPLLTLCGWQIRTLRFLPIYILRRALTRRINQDPYRVCVWPLSFRSLLFLPPLSRLRRSFAW